MFIRRAARVIVALSGLVAFLASGCGSTPVQPTTLRLLALQPALGLFTGGTAVRLIGSGFEPGATVTIDNLVLAANFVNSFELLTTLPAHAVGAVDVVVTNPGGLSQRLANGFSYVQMFVNYVFPLSGTTHGGTQMGLGGNWFQSGAVVTLGSAPISATFLSSQYIYFDTEPHAAGTVDIVVTNPDGEVYRVPGGYTFAEPESFDLNGTWDAYTPASPDDAVFTFTIQNNALVSVTCGKSAPLTLAPSSPVRGGEFTYSTPAGAALFGRVTAASLSRGTINLSPCPVTTWDGYKR